MRSIRATSPVILIDNGDVNKGYGRQPELKYETALKAMAETGYLAANVGERDLLLGVDYLKYVADFTGVPLLGANITTTEGGPVFEAYVSERVSVGAGSVEAAVIGIISPSFSEEIEQANPWLMVEEYEPILEELVDELREQADMLILLAHAPEEEALLIAEDFPQIDLIISSHSGDDPFSQPINDAGVPIGFSGEKGMHVGVAAFEFEGGKARLASYMPQKLDGKIEDSKNIAPFLEDYQQMLRAERLLENFPKSHHEMAKFVGNKECQRCHSLSFRRFGKSRHNHAFEALVDGGHHYDPECVLCHTVGFGYATGFESPETTPELEHVGCENCHGPGEKHIEDPMNVEYGKVDRDTCEFCHNPDNSPKFVYEERIEKIKHDSFFLCSARICHWLD